MNIAIVHGKLGRDPELKAGETSVCRFSLATDEYSKGEKKAEWHNVVCFGKTAELAAKYLSKGAGAVVVGRLQTSNWEKDGVKHYKTEIIADRVEFTGGKGGKDAAEDMPF